MTITEFRKNIAQAAETIRQDVLPMLLTQGNKEPLVVMPLSQFSSYDETAYLMSTEANRQALNQSIQNDKVGKNMHHFASIEDAEAFALKVAKNVRSV